jgi:hypothetical protein
MPLTELQRALVRLRSDHFTTAHVSSISPRLAGAGGTLDCDAEFDRLYELIVTGRAGFTTTRILSGVAYHTSHEVFIHPKITDTWPAYGHYTTSGLLGVLCPRCCEPPASGASQLQLSTQNMPRAKSWPTTEYKAFIGYAVAAPRDVLAPTAGPGASQNKRTIRRPFWI